MSERGDYSELHVADLYYGASLLEELANATASNGAGRDMADKVEAAAQAVRLAIEVLNDLHQTVTGRALASKENPQEQGGGR